jgi:CheY-like chemotaxis protein
MCGDPKQELTNGWATSERSPGILIADDMALILTLLKLELECRGFAVWLAMNGVNAVDLYQRHVNEIDLVLLDVHMPGLDGPRTLEALQRHDPDVVAFFMSGNLGSYTEEELLDRGAAWVFSKPFRPAEVAEVLHQVACASGSTPFVCDWQTPSRAMNITRKPADRRFTHGTAPRTAAPEGRCVP